jgi:hypothetical protein
VAGCDHLEVQGHMCLCEGDVNIGISRRKIMTSEYRKTGIEQLTWGGSRASGRSGGPGNSCGGSVPAARPRGGFPGRAPAGRRVPIGLWPHLP